MRILITITGCTVVVWLVAWFTLNYPPSYPATNYDVCNGYDDPYEIGFCEGYHWSGSQLQIDNAIRAELENKLPS